LYGSRRLNARQAEFIQTAVPHPAQLITVAIALRKPPITTVPIANANLLTPAGDAVQQNQPQARPLFTDLRTGNPVPDKLLTGSHLPT
jgi:hypothetical protein